MLHDYLCAETQLQKNAYVNSNKPFKAYWLLDGTICTNIQQLYALPTSYLCVLYLSENKQRLVPLTA